MLCFTHWKLSLEVIVKSNECNSYLIWTSYKYSTNGTNVHESWRPGDFHAMHTKLFTINRYAFLSANKKISTKYSCSGFLHTSSIQSCKKTVEWFSKLILKISIELLFEKNVADISRKNHVQSANVDYYCKYDFDFRYKNHFAVWCKVRKISFFVFFFIPVCVPFQPKWTF